MATKRHKKLAEILRTTKPLTGKQLEKMVTQQPEYPIIHPSIKRIVGNMILATAHPNGIIEGMKERAFIEMMTKSYTWLCETQEQMVIVINHGHDISLTFKENGIECKQPF